MNKLNHMLDLLYHSTQTDAPSKKTIVDEFGSVRSVCKYGYVSLVHSTLVVANAEHKRID